MVEERVLAAVKDAYGFLTPEATLQERREAYDCISRKLPDGVELRDDEIAGVQVLWVRPQNVTSPKVVVMVHGGGFHAGSTRSHRDIAAHRPGQQCARSGRRLSAGA
jgi:epsilon-lactone hydrolase